MRNTIEGFRQDYLLKLHLLQSDAIVLRWMLSYMQSKDIKHIDVLENGKEERYYWIFYEKVIEDLPTLYISNKVVIGKMLKRICGEGKENENQYPLKKYTYWDHKVKGNKTYFRFRPDILSLMETTMNGFGLELPNPKQEKSYGSLNPNVERILLELDKLKLPDNRKLFSFTMPTDHKIHTKSMKRFQDCLYDLYEGRFNSRNKIADWFKEKNRYYLDDLIKPYLNCCKNDWNYLYELIIKAANNYISWFEKDRETVNKDWLTRDIGSWMYYSLKQTSMFMVCIKCKATKTREVIAEKTFNNLPSHITNLFQEFYKDEWDGLTYWNKIYSVYKWYKDNAKNLINKNINYSYWLDKGINNFMQEYYDFINTELGIKYLKHFGTKTPTWNWFIQSKKDEHGIDE
jgi:hypothetical protein